jgi:inner membrane transporter RhtA
LTRDKNIGVLATLLSMISIQGGASFAKFIFPLLGSTGTCALRVCLAAALLFGVNRPKIFALSGREWLYTALYGISLGCMNLLFYHAIRRIPLGIAVAVEFIGPLVFAMLQSRSLLDFVWAVIAGTGILLIVPWHNTGIDPIGLLFAMGAGLFWACYIFWGGKISRFMAGKDAVTLGMCIAGALALPFGIISGELGSLSPKLLVLGLGVAVFSSALPYSLEFMALKKLPAKTFSILLSLEPAVGALAGLAFLGEMLVMRQWAAIACVILASLGAAVCSPKERLN